MVDTEDWKARYRKEAGEWEVTEDLLRRVLGRLTIAAEGVSDELDGVLASMQRHARDRDDRALEADLKTLTAQLRRLDGAAPSAPAPAPAQPEELPDAPRSEHSRDGGVREVLLAIVDEVAVVQPGAGAMETLREKLQRGIGGDWNSVLDRVIGEIRSLIQRISSEKQALEQLVQDVSTELGGISEVLVEERDGMESGRSDALALHDIMRDGVTRIQQQIDTQSDIDQLKSSINLSLEGIRLGVAEFVSRDEERFAAAQARSEALQERIGRMEDEAEEMRKNLERNREKLLQDTLTGVRSRLAYDETLARELSRYRRYHSVFSLAVLDIDHFKRVNDDYGHSAGDKALKLVAELMQGRIRESDFIFRTGGEEFVVLLPGTTISGARPVVEELRHAVAESGFHYESRPVAITLSAGLTQVREEDTAETLFDRADDAMYRAKKAGRNQLVTLE